MVIVIQFTFLLIMNQFYLHQPLFISDIVAFFIILFAFVVSMKSLLSKALGLPVPTPAPTASRAPGSTTTAPVPPLAQPANDYSA